MDCDGSQSMNIGSHPTLREARRHLAWLGTQEKRKWVDEQPASLFATLGIARRKGFNIENEVLTKSLERLEAWVLEAAI